MGPTGSAQAPASNAGTKCDNCQEPIREDDRFCGHCGYSRKKCAACSKKLLSAGNFCPTCGAARGGQQVIRTSSVSSRARGIRSFARYLAAPVLVVLIATAVFRQPTILRSTAQSFFRNYFAEVTNGQQRGRIYAQEVTTSFKQFNPQWQYNGFWETVKSAAVVQQVYSVQGTSSEFTVSLKESYKAGGPPHYYTWNFWLVCTGLYGHLMGKIWAGCPQGALKIDNQLAVSPASGNG
jgi:Double zinc ribbon